MKLWDIVIKAVAAITLGALALPAGAVTVTYSFTNVVGNVSGTVFGHIDGLVDNATTAATAVWVDAYPAGLAGSAGLGSYPAPFDVLSSWSGGTVSENSFTLSGGIVTAAFFSLTGANGDSDQLFLNSACACSFATGHTNFLDIGTNDSAYVWNVGDFNARDGLLIPGDPTDGVPEAATWAMMVLGFFGLGATLRTRRKIGSALA